MTTLAMSAAVAGGDAAAVLGLLRGGADPARAGDEGLTPLLLAIRRGRMAVVDVLLDWHGDRLGDVGLEARDEHGQTALNLAMHHGGVALLRRLLRAGADQEARGLSGYTPLIGATVRDDSEKVELLLAYGAPLESRNLDNTALHMACIAGSVRSARALVGRGADVNARGMNGNPPLIMAMANLELLRLLLRAGADPAVTCAGWTALHGCSDTNAHEAVAELLAAGADPTPRTPGGTTPVSLALAGRHAETLRLLLDAGGGPLPDRDRLPVDDWRFLNESQARWRVEAEAALAAERAALAAERAAHIATQDSFRFALPHVLQAACRPTKRPRLD